MTVACDYIIIQELPGHVPQTTLDVQKIRNDFPILRRKVHGRALVYLDNAASTQKPRAMIDALKRFYERDYANIHRGVHLLSQVATDAYENARVKVQRQLGAADSREVIFTRGTTEAINLVAATYGRQHVGAGDEVLITAMEHHSNIVPWQMLCQEKGARLRVAPISDAGELILDELEKLLGPRTKMVSVAHVSNVLGTVNPVARIIEMAHARGIAVLVDGAQSMPHMKIDVQALDCDFFAFSGHKMYGPSGIGALYGKRALLEEMPPYQGGGEMISSVTFEKTVFNDLPYKFEAGTPSIADGVALGATIDYLNQIGIDNIAAYERELLEYATAELARVPGLRIIGTAAEKSGVISFVLEGIHPHEIGTILDIEGIAIRTGHHCAQPLMERYGLAATARASLAMYNTKHEIGALVGGLQKVIEHQRVSIPWSVPPEPEADSVADIPEEPVEEEPVEVEPPPALGPYPSDEEVLSSSNLRELYSDMIKDHGYKPRNFRRQDDANHQARGQNPLCGDQLTVYLNVDRGRIKDVSFLGKGCAISTASASIMTQTLKGKTLEEAEQIFQQFHKLLTLGLDPNGSEEALGKLMVFSGVRKFPVRVKCATLPWHTLHAALEEQKEATASRMVTTE